MFLEVSRSCSAFETTGITRPTTKLYVSEDINILHHRSEKYRSRMLNISTRCRHMVGNLQIPSPYFHEKDPGTHWIVDSLNLGSVLTHILVTLDQCFSNGGRNTTVRTGKVFWWYAKEFRNYLFLQQFNFISVNCITKIVLNMFKCKEKHKVYTKILFHCSNINTSYPVSSNRD